DAALSAGSSSEFREEEPSVMEERATIGSPYEGGEESPSSFSAEGTVIDRAYSESGQRQALTDEAEGVAEQVGEERDQEFSEGFNEESGEVPMGATAGEAGMESEDALPEAERSESPLWRERLSVVPPSGDREPPKEPFFTEQVQGAEPELSEPRSTG